MSGCDGLATSERDGYSFCLAHLTAAEQLRQMPRVAVAGKSLETAEAETVRVFEGAVRHLGVCFERDERGEYTDSRTVGLWRVWCQAQEAMMVVESGFRPEFGSEVRTVDRAAEWLAKSLRDVADDFGVIPQMVPAVVLSALMKACPVLIESKDADRWPGSLTDHRARMRRNLAALALSLDD